MPLRVGFFHGSHLVWRTPPCVSTALKFLPLNTATHTAVGRSLLSLFHLCCKVTSCQNTSVFLPEPLLFIFPCHSLFRWKNNVCEMAVFKLIYLTMNWVIRLLVTCLKFRTVLVTLAVRRVGVADGYQWLNYADAKYPFFLSCHFADIQYALHTITVYVISQDCVFIIHTAGSQYTHHCVIQLFIQFISSRRAVELAINSWLARTLSVIQASQCDVTSNIQFVSLLLSAQIAWHWSLMTVFSTTVSAFYSLY